MQLAEYMFRRIRELGVTHTFGIPGDYALLLYVAQAQSGLKTVVMTHEPSVGYAADVYARLQGLGVAIVTYGVGTLNMVNAIAMAYAEESPVLVIAGAPEVGWQKADSLFHHRVKSSDTQLRVMREVTTIQASITDPISAVEQIDEVLAAISQQSRPGFIEIARDVVFANVEVPAKKRGEQATIHHAEALREAVAEIVAKLNSSKCAVICAGVEIERFGLRDSFKHVVEKLNLPVATTLMGKAVLPENHPNFIGTYFGNLGPESTRKYVENSDCILSLGMLFSDVDVGFDASRIARSRLIQATAEGVSVSYHRYPHIQLAELLKALLESPSLTRHSTALPALHAKSTASAKSTTWGTGAIIEYLNGYLLPNHLVIADTGDCLFASVELRANCFIAPGYYASMGLAIPGAIGAQLARPQLRPIVLIGDGSFKMNGVELGTACDLGLNPIVVLLNNRSFATLRAADQNRDYYQVRPWDYVALARSLGGQGMQAHDLKQFRDALAIAEASKTFFVIDAVLPDGDASPTLLRLGEEYGGHIRSQQQRQES